MTPHEPPQPNPARRYAADDGGGGMSRRAARFTEADAFRAIRAIKRSGDSMAVEITPDGTIRIVPAIAPVPLVAKPKLAPGKKIVL